MVRTLVVTTAMLVLWACPAAAAERRVCVEVVLQEGATRPPVPARADRGSAFLVELRGLDASSAPATPPSPREGAHAQPTTRDDLPYLPLGQNPISYLRRLVEHFVSHERGYVAVRERCEDTISVELYPLREGWTVFARYSRTGREERVDRLFPHELSQFAERAVLALLRDRSIATTIKRDTVLRSDSMKAIQRIRGTHHFMLGLGTDLRIGKLPTAQSDGSAKAEWRLSTPMALLLGYQGKLQSWSLRTTVEVGIGTSETGVRKNTQGGHVDFGGDAAFAIHFLRYLSPRGITSFYLGGGASFEVVWFSMIAPQGSGNDRERLVSGGLDVDLVVGYELMRASWAYFYLEAAAKLPAYRVERDHRYGSIDTWMPGVALRLGVGF